VGVMSNGHPESPNTVECSDDRQPASLRSRMKATPDQPIDLLTTTVRRRF
jgi:hypothetical protein